MSIQALAQSLGLSISTVSRALNGYSDVSVKTRARVFEAARNMNYQPHPVAQRLATGKAGAVAVITSVHPRGGPEAGLTTLMTGIAAVLRARHLFTMGLGIPTDEHESAEFERLLSAKLFDAVILTRTRCHDARVALLQARGMPFITYGRTLDNAPHAWVDADHERAFAQLTDLFIEQGHRRIAFINGMPHMTFARLRETGFRQSLARAGLDTHDCPVHYTEINADSGEQVATALLARSPRPSAIVCCSDPLALGAMTAIRRAGLRVGVDVSVAGYGNSDASAHADPALTTMNPSLYDNGRQLAQLLLQVMNGENAQHLTALDQPQLVRRASVGPC